MTDEQDDALSDLLSRWHTWQQGERFVRGHATTALVVGQFKVSRQYDDTNGKLDDDLDALRSRQVNHEVKSLDEPYKTAIHIDARNLCTGIAVWDSPRMPRDPEERADILNLARMILAKRLISAGVMA